MTSPRGDDGAPSGVRPARVAPVGAGFHLVALVPVAVLLWAASIPGGGSLLVWIFCGLALAVIAVAWSMRLLSWAVARRHEGADGSPWWFAVVPVAAAAVAVLLVSDVPLRARFDDARPELDRLVEDAPVAGPGQVIPFDVPGWAGSYRIAGAERVGDDVFVTVSSPLSWGRIVVLDAGFAFASDGLPPTTFPGGQQQRRIDLQPLGGGWYAWSASW